MIKKRILVFAHETDLNGASLSLLTILIGLKKEFDFFVIIPGIGVMENALIANNINYKILKTNILCTYPNYVSILDHFKRSFFYYESKTTVLNNLIYLCNSFNPDLVYTNTSVIDIGFDLSKEINKPHVWHIREYGDIDFKLNYLPFRKMIVDKLKKSNEIIFTTNLLKNHWLGSKKGNINIIYNGVFEGYNSSIEKKIKISDVLNIAIVGIVTEAKGQLEAVNIINSVIPFFKETHLYIYGNVDEHYYKLLLNLIHKKKLAAHIHFMGYVERKLIYPDIDILLSCSRNEALGRTIIEAMGYGIPVIAKNAGGPTEILDNGIDAFLYDSIDQAANIIIELIKNPMKYIEIGNNAIKSAEKKFSISMYLKSINIVFSKVLNIK